MFRKNKNSMLIAGIPVQHQAKGIAHFIDDEDFAFTMYRDGKVHSVTTPQGSIFKQVHEMLHARYTKQEKYNEDYARVLDGIGQTVEDCRLHVKYWPWENRQTPKLIADEAMAVISEDLEVAEKHTSNPLVAGPVFCGRIRAACVRQAITNRDWYQTFEECGFRRNSPQWDLACNVVNQILVGNNRRAAELIQRAFVPDIKYPETEDKEQKIKSRKRNMGMDCAITQPRMEIIELPLTNRLKAAKRSYKRARMGCRLWRPALRKIVLPKKPFLKRLPSVPQGTVLVDASGSMGSFDVIRSWIEKLPFATIAYYAGQGEVSRYNDCDGWLYICARGGRIASDLIEPEDQGNTVDGPAIDWLLKQKGPRLFITDRGFCGASDSSAQKVRLQMLEASGELKVCSYKIEDEDDDVE